ncbi:MAG TPA: hypothetical protein VIM24_12605 [Candidatus Limnocylindrales bacterium]
MTLSGDEPAIEAEAIPGATPAPVESLLSEPATGEPLPSTPAMPSTLAIVSRGLDLNVAASAEIRRASLYVGLLWLLSAGPIAAVVWAFSAHQGGFDWLRTLATGHDLLLVPVGSAFEWLSLVVVIVGFACLVSISIDAQLVATILIGARATGRRLDLRAALALARLRYWRLVRATLLVFAILLVPRFVINRVVMNGQPVGTDAQDLVVTAINILLSVPFAYVAAGIVLGAVGAWEAVRRSWRLARARFRLAFLIAIVNTAVSYIAGFALGAGADVLGRLGTAFGIGLTMGPIQIVVLAAIVAFAIVSIGSLVMTVDALTVGPQIVAFLGMTGYANGLDATKDPHTPFAAPRVEPLISRPMKIALVVSAAAAVLAVLNLG